MEFLVIHQQKRVKGKIRIKTKRLGKKERMGNDRKLLFSINQLNQISYTCQTRFTHISLHGSIIDKGIGGGGAKGWV